MASPTPFVKSHWVAADGGPCAGCLLWSFAAGTNIPQATYTTTAGNVANTNPVALDAAGYVDIFLGPSPYKFVLETAAIPGHAGHGSVIWTEDNITNSAQLASVAYLPPYTGGITRTSTSKWAEEVSVQDFGADPTGVVDSSGAFQAAVNVGASSRGGVAAKIPCGSYTLGSTVTMALPTQSLIGENEGCVHLNYIGTSSAIIWQMSPFTTNPAGEMSGFTLICLSAAQNGILSGQIVGSWMHNIDVSGCTQAGAAAIHLHNAGTFTTWTERNHYGPELSTGGIGANRNAIGFLLSSDNPADSFGYNVFEDIKVNASTGQEGFRLASGFFYNSSINMSACNIENNVAGTVGPICIRSHGNWDGNLLQLHGEFQNSGGGTGTPYRFQVDAGGRFSNLKGSNIDVLAPGGAQVADNVIPAAASSPNVTLVQGTAQTSWDTGTFTLGGVVTTPQPIQRANFGSLGLLIGNNIESPYVSMFQGTGDKFQWLTVPSGSPIGSGIDIGGVDLFGNLFSSAYHTQCNALLSNCNAPGTIDGAAIMNIGATTSVHRSGLTNSYYLTTTGINESTSGDPNFSGGNGFVEGANIAHPMSWCYVLDPNCYEWYAKTFQTPLNSGNKLAGLSNLGDFALKGHLNQIGAAHNIGGTVSLSATDNGSASFAAFNSPPLCFVTVFTTAAPPNVAYGCQTTTTGITVWAASAVTATFNYFLVGNPD